MATLVTGGTGFIGANTVLELARRGHQVVSLDIEPVNDLVLRNLEPWAERVTWLQGDVLNTELIQRIGSGHDIEHVIHTAAYTPYGSLEKTDWGRKPGEDRLGTGRRYQRHRHEEPPRAGPRSQSREVRLRQLNWRLPGH